MDASWPAPRVFLLLAVANTAPLRMKHWLGARWAAPLDGGRTFLDGRALLGASKTIRGIVAAVVATARAAVVMGMPATLGAGVGGGAMLGDLLSSFAKRRLGLSPLQIVAITLAFFVREMPAARLYHRAGLPDQPD